MKKLRFIVVALFLFLVSGNVNAANSVDSIKMDIYIDPNGTAHITETWDAYLSEGTEGYKPYYNLGNSKIQNFKVYDGDDVYTNIGNWDTGASFKDKTYKNGLNYLSDGIELCFGISKYGSHEYRMEYEITNFVAGLKDADMVYWTLMPHNFSASPDDVYIKIYADEAFSDNLDVWGYGNYGGTAYVNDGYIEMSSDGILASNEYMTVLVKFPKGTFDTTNNKYSNNFNYYLEMAEEGAEHYNESDTVDVVYLIVELLIGILFPSVGMFLIMHKMMYSGINLSFGKTGNELPKDVPLYRDLPCDKDIYRAYWVATNYGLMKKKTDFLGAVLLKWLKEGKITITKEEKGILKKEKISITFNETLDSTNSVENELYSMMVEASEDYKLEENEFKKWCEKNYFKILNWFDKFEDDQTLKMQADGMAEETTKKTLGVIKTKFYNVNPVMFEEAKKMKGLKKFLEEFSLINTREAIEVTMWEEYLMYAQIFGIADKVAKQFKKMYPDVIADYSYDSVIFVNHIAYVGMNSARSASNSASSSGSGGGGGFSSGGGGGGSFGGGGGGGGFR